MITMPTCGRMLPLEYEVSCGKFVIMPGRIHRRLCQDIHCIQAFAYFQMRECINLRITQAHKRPSKSAPFRSLTPLHQQTSSCVFTKHKHAYIITQ